MDGLNFDRRTLVILAAILAGAVALTWVFATRQPSAQPAPLAPVAAVTAASPSASPSLSATPEVVVEVVGKVRNPAVITLPQGSRVQDALEAVGGARAGVDTSDQNLARLLVDGEQIRIGMRAATTAPGAPAVPGPASAPGQIDINTASVEVLQEIPGVGPVLAGRIVTFREQNGGFTSVEQLTEVSGIGEVTFAQMKPMVTIGAGG
jgi:competence protein ComEA